MIKGMLLGLQDITSRQLSVAAGHGRRLHYDAPQWNRGRGPLVARDRARTAIPLGKRLRYSGVSSLYYKICVKKNKKKNKRRHVRTPD